MAGPQLIENAYLFLRAVPFVLQPNLARTLEFRVGGLFLAADLIDRFAQQLHQVEVVEGQFRIGELFGEAALTELSYAPRPLSGQANRLPEGRSNHSSNRRRPLEDSILPTTHGSAGLNSINPRAFGGLVSQGYAHKTAKSPVTHTVARA